jgi:multidrug efflux pump subunit AcrB
MDRDASPRCKPAITLNVVKRQGENLIDASDKIKVLWLSKASLPAS